MNTLGINKPKKETKVVVAMSGGVDSSVVAALMKQEGYDVTGITLKLYDDAKQSKEGRQCCAGQDIMDAKRVSEKININHEILYYQKKFRSEVIDSFIDSYAAGETPIPCVQCNQTVKFRDLFKYAKDLKADALVTGHYVSRIQKNGHANMYRAKDYNRDQSYFLFSTTQEQLDYLRFPLGEIEKYETRSLAKKLNLNVADKPDSQDICFVPNGDYSSVIKKYRPESFKKGKIIDLLGNQIGEHDGIINYTIGQRKGMATAGGTDPRYAIDVDVPNATVTVGKPEDLLVDSMPVKDCVWANQPTSGSVLVQISAHGKPMEATLKDNNVYWAEPQRRVAPGQAVVFYSDNKVLGGGMAC